MSLFIVIAIPVAVVAIGAAVVPVLAGSVVNRRAEKTAELDQGMSPPSRESEQM